MNASDVLKYGHLWVHKHLDGLTETEWEAPGVCGVWSVKEIIAHLASFECTLVDVFNSFLHDGPTPKLDRYKTLSSDEFNAVEVGRRKNMSVDQVLTEYDDTQAQVMSLVSQIPPETLRQPGTIPWYGEEYALDDFIVYAFYGHKREHCAQIAVYRDRLGK